jgi:hypothetical protein
MLYEAPPAAAHHGQLQNLMRVLAALAAVQIEFRHQQQEGFSVVLDIVGEASWRMSVGPSTYSVSTNLTHG